VSPQGGDSEGVSNAVIAHTRDGIEVVEVRTGRPVCSVVLPPHQLHADVNRDGMVDHAWATGDAKDERGAGLERAGAPRTSVNRCWGYVTTGAGGQQKLFDGTLCRLGRSYGPGGGLTRSAARNFNDAPVEVAAPSLLPVLSRGAPAVVAADAPPHLSPLVAEQLVTFLNSRGIVVAYASTGRRVFEVDAGAWWRSQEGVPGARRPAPTLTSVRLAAGAGPFAVLAAGSVAGAVLGPSGQPLARLDLPVPPLQPLLPEDLDGDGLTDLLLVGRDGVYAYAQVLHPGALPFRALVGALGVALVLVYLGAGGRGAPGGGMAAGSARHF